jgi:hypothetical protein
MLQSASAAAGCFTRAATVAPRPEVNAAIKLETVHVEIDLYRIGALQEFLIDDVRESFDIKLFILIVRLVQSHGQTRAASSAFIEKNPNGPNILILEIFGNLCRGRRCYF